MSEEYNKCPKCYNYIDDFNSDKSEINRERGGLGVDDNGDPLPFWSDDPIYTPLGLSGDDYKGMTIPKSLHISELQDYYSELEVSALGSENLSEFLETKIIKHLHIEQLRVSIENLLDEMGLTLEDYFKYDRHGNEITTTQTEWTDVNRIVKDDLSNPEDFNYIAGTTVPLLPSLSIVRAIHIEELRIGITSGFWQETWTDNNPTFQREFAVDGHIPSFGGTPRWGYKLDGSVRPSGSVSDAIIPADNEIIVADNNWHIYQAGLSGSIYDWREHIWGNTNLDVSGGVLSYSSSVNMDCPDWNSAYIVGNGVFLLLGESLEGGGYGISSINIPVNPTTTISWTGSLSGTANNTSPYILPYCYAQIKILLKNVWGVPYKIFLYKMIREWTLPSNNAFNIYIKLDEWEQAGLNIYNIIEAVGLWGAIPKIIQGVEIRFIANTNGIVTNPPGGELLWKYHLPIASSASISATIDNIKIG